MMSKCSAACGLCTPLCQDHDESCAAWAQAGECESNAQLLRACPASCGLCHELEGGAEAPHDEL